MSLLDLAYDEIPLLRAYDEGRGEIVFEEAGRPLSEGRSNRQFNSAFDGPIRMSLLRNDGAERFTLAFGKDEDELRDYLSAKMMDLSDFDELKNEAGDLPARYRDFIQEIRFSARDAGVDISEVRDIEFVREWQRHSETSAASWLIPSDEDYEWVTRRVLATETSPAL
ncbi:hypothetical protein G6L37_35200 [Agrobacterium rubi]|nr:hypothetical protein [Agrobacterium rubi]NTF23818.1 hypothetical protein [Agrobacterium rubi]